MGNAFSFIMLFPTWHFKITLDGGVAALPLLVRQRGSQRWSKQVIEHRSEPRTEGLQTPRCSNAMLPLHEGQLDYRPTSQGVGIMDHGCFSARVLASPITVDRERAKQAGWRLKPPFKNVRDVRQLVLFGSASASPSVKCR